MFSMFSQVQQFQGHYRKAVEDGQARTKAWVGEVDKAEVKTAEQSAVAIDEWARLAKESIKYTQDLAAEWRKLVAEPIKP